MAAVLLDPAIQAHARAGSFRFRGVIEGFYGPPWSASGRMGMLRWMATHGMNTYIHAPKDDLYQRAWWRRPYPPSAVASFRKEAAWSARHGLLWVAGVSPGLTPNPQPQNDRDICFSCPGDRAVVFSKLDSLWAAGVRSFFVGFDDGARYSSHIEDEAAYGVGDAAYGTMNADLLNAIYQRYRVLSSRFRLFTVLADFAGTGSTPYLDSIRTRLLGSVEILWTGSSVVSPKISCVDAGGYAAAVGRRPIIWDNFPVNDYAPNKLIIGPVRGRTADLPSCVKGLVANPMTQVRASRIPLFTVADYLTSPRRYRPERSWRRSLREFAGDAIGMLRPFVANIRSTPLDRTEAVRFNRLRDRFLGSLGGSKWRRAYRALTRELREEVATPERIRRRFFDRRFVNEIDHGPWGSWLDRLAFNARNGLEVARHLAATRPRLRANLRGGRVRGVAHPPVDSSTAKAWIEILGGMRQRDDGNPPNVHGDRDFPPGVVVDENRMDAFFLQARNTLSAYVDKADLAASGVEVRVNGQLVPHSASGEFSLWTDGNTAVIVAVDPSGGKTRMVLHG